MEEVYAEVYEVLKNVPKEKFYKVPKKVTSFFEKYRDYSTGEKIDLNKSFEEQNISQKAKDIIFCISLNYWLSDKEKKEAIRKMKINEKVYLEKYSADNLFNKIDNGKNILQESNSDVKGEIVEYKESFIKRLLNGIKSFFKKLRNKSKNI